MGSPTSDAAQLGGHHLAIDSAPFLWVRRVPVKSFFFFLVVEEDKVLTVMGYYQGLFKGGKSLLCFEIKVII